MVNRFTFLGLVTALSVFGLGLFVFSLADSNGNASTLRAEATTPAVPPATETEPQGTPLQRAAEAAGCELIDPPNEGAEHVAEPTTSADYGSNPPTSGIHAPMPAPAGIYERKHTPSLESTVHSLEHGRINVQYAEGTPDATVEQLAKFVESAENGYHLLLFENQTKMPYAIAATAWDHLIGCDAFTAETIQALGLFWQTYVDQGPEFEP